MVNYFEFVLVLVIIGLGILLYKFYQKKKQNEKEIEILEKEKDEYADFGKGLAEYNKKISQLKEKRKQKILESLKEKGKLKTKGVADILEVSRATAFRYLEELKQKSQN